jgi:membrane-bound serine protease (ClpP class)
MIGAIALTRTPLNPTGQVEIRGEIWRARLQDQGSLTIGSTVCVRSIDGLTLLVDPAPNAIYH